MANRMVGEGTAQADGKTWTLRFDMNTLGNLEREMHKPAMAILAEMDNGNAPIDTRRMICHAMLRKYHPDAPIEVAGEILSEDPDAFFAVLKAALPGQEGNTPGKAPAEAGKAA